MCCPAACAVGGRFVYPAQPSSFCRQAFSGGNTETQADQYTAININTKLTVEQRKVLERVFDLICQEYSDADAQAFINTIANKF